MQLPAVDDGVPAIRKGRVGKKAAEAQKKITEKPKHENVIVVISYEKEKAKAVEAQKKLSSEKPEAENVIMISAVEEGKVKPVDAGSSKEVSLRNVKTLYSILSARSKVVF